MNPLQIINFTIIILRSTIVYQLGKDVGRQPLSPQSLLPQQWLKVARVAGQKFFLLYFFLPVPAAHSAAKLTPHY